MTSRSTGVYPWTIDGLHLALAEVYRCPHGVVFARRSSEGVYSGSTPSAVCSQCLIESFGPET